ncbi:hypothetical protein Cgig2_023664 [Carnegiea gigantea]|uniref:Uncharacterized protein n=1 Tax=Carnegiea gigantea TaxID=171969 RepID=A0A9Q1QK68_9CARY|nr:hypothetical protein Cgig2_023664 [Carnegiea gigantea]
MEAANSVRPLPHFDYVPTAGCKPSYRQVRVPSPHSAEREREASWSNRGGRPYSGHHDWHMTTAVRPSGHPIQGQTATAKSTIAFTPYATHSRRTVWLKKQEEQEPAQPQLRDEECSAEVMATIARGYAEGMTRSAWKAQLVQFIWRILIDTGSSVDIITWDCLKKLMRPGRDIIPLVHPIFALKKKEEEKKKKE